MMQVQEQFDVLTRNQEQFDVLRVKPRAGSTVTLSQNLLFTVLASARKCILKTDVMLK